MKDLLALAEHAVEAAVRAGATYADARVVRLEREELLLRNGELASADAPEELGIGVRALFGGALGFAALPLAGGPRSASSDERVAGAAAARAVEVARALAALRREPVELAGRESARGEYETPVEIDPFALPFAEKLAFLRDAEASVAGADATVVREAALSLRREESWQASSEGARIRQRLVRTGAGLATTAAAHGQVQRRSHPASFGGNFTSGGFEHALSLDLPAHGARLRDESLALCSADPCPAGRRTLIASSNQLMLQIHESVGHPDELDRVLGHEVDLAGSSFVAPDDLGRLRFGSPIVHLVADAELAGGLDTRGYDDECVPSRRFDVVRDGLFVGFHTSREWAGRIGENASRATARAEGWYNPPIIRITNLSLEPGTSSFDELVAGTEDGVLVDTVKTWSIDQRRLNFQFTTEIGWEIRDGRIGRMLRDPTYQGSTPAFWRSCDAIADRSHWKLWGIANCGKGNPMQLAEMSHGASPARFRDVTFVR